MWDLVVVLAQSDEGGQFVSAESANFIGALLVILFVARILMWLFE